MIIKILCATDPDSKSNNMKLISYVTSMKWAYFSAIKNKVYEHLETR